MTPPEYVAARTVLLDALEALGPHLDAVVLVGAQAVYLHSGDGDLAVAPTTTDADIALVPSRLCDEPLIAAALRDGGFVPGRNPGTWHGQGDIAIDLLVPDALSGLGGRRGARLSRHGNRVARRTFGLEPAAVDNQHHELTALDPADRRRMSLRVAGPAALLISKIVKIEERMNEPRRLRPKDGLDILRLLRGTDLPVLAQRLGELGDDPLAAAATGTALAALRAHGTDRAGPVATLAGTAVAGLEDVDTTSEAVVLLVEELIQAYDALPRSASLR